MTHAIIGDTTDKVVLGGFVLREKIGEGGFGTVYLAEQQALGRAAVVKVMRASLAVRRDAVERFVLEARLASRLDHPCAAHIYACGAEPDGTLWIAMELVRGTSLDHLIQESGPLPVERAVPMLERLCEAVQAAHDQGIVHRDIKPANVMIQAKGGRLMPKLLDFGIAKLLVGDASSPAARAKRPTNLDVAARELECTATAMTGATELGASTANLTQAGQILGSPPYMAPEQWMDPTLVGPDTDQYSLALLAFEAITGERACTGANLTALAAQHIDQPLRTHPLISDRIHGVLVRATAKEPTARYRGLTAFTTALREAAGLVAEVEEHPPTLEPELAASWIADAPQPLAEAIAAVTAARSSQRAYERAKGAAGMVAQWLGVLALACRSRTGTGDAAAVEAVRELRRRAPHANGWIDLVVATCRGAAERPELWPIPELATWCTDAAAIATLRELVRNDAAIIDADRSKDRAAHQLALLAKVLRELGWLLDYPVGRHVDAGIELWMGVRGDERVVQRTRSSGSGIVMLDADGVRVVQLAPLVEVVQPMAGEGEEMFVFGGPSRANRPLYTAFPRGFERDDLAAWDALGTRLFDRLATADAVAEDHSPYPGLRSFSTSDHASFVGREHEVHELVNRLRAQPIVTIVGPSGAGKSSFLAAGLVPALPIDWRAITLRPGRAPMATLAMACERLEASPYRERMRADTGAEGLLGLVEHESTTLVLIVDQSEELFTQNASLDERLAFAAAIAAFIEHPRARVVLGVRDDFLVRLEELVPWRGVIARNVQILAMPARAALERIVSEPARRLGYDFEDPTLPATMVGEVIDRPGALPLLAFAAAELWEHRDRHFKQIKTASYREIGGVTGALVQHADGIVDRLTAGERKLVRLAFRRLLTAEGARVVHNRSELVSALGGDDAANRVVEKLLSARLVVSRDDDAGERIEIIHEALTRTWPLLETWRREDATGAKLHEQLVAAAKHWQERERPDGLLWRDAALADLERWRASNGGLTHIETAFADASRASSRRGRRRRLVAIGAAFVALSSTVVVLGVASHRLADQREAAVRRVAAGFEERGRAAEVAGDHARALLYLAEAARMGEHGAGHDLLVSSAARSVDSLDRVEIHDDQGIGGAHWDQASILTAQWQTSRARLWDRATGRLRLTIANAVNVFPLEGGVVAYLETDEVARIEPTGQRRWTTPVGGVGNLSGTLAANGVVVAYHGATATILNADTGAKLASFETDGTAITGVTFDADARRIATAAGSKIRVWSVADASLLATCVTASSRMQSVMFTPDGRRVVGGGDDGVVRLCDLETGSVTSLSGHLNLVSALRIDRSCTLLASASFDGTVRLWKLATGESHGVLTGHRGPVRALELSPDGRMAATGGDDATVRIWDLESATQLASLEGHAGRISSLSWQDGILESASQDGTVRRWNLQRALPSAIGHPHTKPVTTIDVTRDGSEVLTRGVDRTTVMWNARSWGFHDAVAGHRELAGAAVLPTNELAAAVDHTLLIRRAKLELGHDIVDVESSATFVVTVSESGLIQRWSLDGKLLGEIKEDFVPQWVRLDPTGTWIVLVPTMDPNGPVVVLASATMQEVARPVTEMKHLQDLVIDRDHLAVATDHELRVFDVGTWKLRRTLHSSGSVATFALAPDGRIIVSSDDGTVAVWDRDDHLVTSLPGSGRSTALDLSHDARLLAVGTADGSVDVWDLEQYRMVATMRGHRLATTSVKFSPDDSHVYSGGRDGRVASWSLARTTRTPADLARLVKCRVPLQLSGERVMPRELDDNDPSCRSLSAP